MSHTTVARPSSGGVRTVGGRAKTAKSARRRKKWSSPARRPLARRPRCGFGQAGPNVRTSRSWHHGEMELERRPRACVCERASVRAVDFVSDEAEARQCVVERQRLDQCVHSFLVACFADLVVREVESGQSAVEGDRRGDGDEGLWAVAAQAALPEVEGGQRAVLRECVGNGDPAGSI